MNKEQWLLDRPKNICISVTGYRILIILKSLIEKSCTINELIQILKEDIYINRPVSKDTIRIAINTLKSAGCSIVRPTKANSYKYKLLKHPFGLNLNEAEFKAFTDLRELLIQNIKWQDVNAVNSLYEKISLLTCNDSQIQYILESKPLKNINQQLIRELVSQKLENRKVNIKYLSPEFGEENIEIIPQKIKYENNKLYLECYSFKYNCYCLLNAERILKINNVDMNKQINCLSTVYSVVYELFGNSVITFDKKENEEILEKTDNTIRIKAIVEDEFAFVQRLLLFGSDFKIIEPLFFKEKLIDKIMLIKKRY